MSSDLSSLPKEQGIMPLEEFMKLSNTEREAYVDKQIKGIGVTSLKLLESITEQTDPNYIELLKKVSGQSSLAAGLPQGRGGYVKRYRKQTRRKKN